MKKTRIVIPALGLIALSTAASITGTVAWFSANQTISISGMQVKTKVGNNLLIAGDTLASVAKVADSSFSQDDLTQTVKGYIEPVSTVNGHDFFYTTNAKADGDAVSDVYIAYNSAVTAENSGNDDTNYYNKFSEDYGVTRTEATTFTTSKAYAEAYVDYVFQIKATNNESAAQKLKLTKLDLTYTKNASESDSEVAYRIAFSVEDITLANPSGDFKATADSIFASGTAENQADADGKNFAVSAANAAPTQLTVAGNKYNNTNAGEIAEVAASTTAYYKIVARLYIEGEDTTCTSSTFAALSGSWALNLEFKLDASATAVTGLSMHVAA